MSSISSTVLYLLLAIACISSSYHLVVDCDQPVFVLETSDSSEAAVSPSQLTTSFQSSNSEQNSAAKQNSNTQIITDDNAPSSNSNHNTNNNPDHNNNKKPAHHQIESKVVVVERNPSGNADHTQAKQPNQQSQTSRDQSQQKESPSVRRLDESPAPSQRAINTRNSQVQTRPKSTTPSYDSQTASVPKSEERLLISITSEEDEYKPPQRQVIASTAGFDEVQPTPSFSQQQQQQQQQQQPQHLKKKPAITISIQDNSNKQGGSGAPSVIVRPSENGQSIIISTLGSIENNNNNNNKYNQNKPAIAILSSNGHNNNNNNNNDPPYREPNIDIPVHHNNHPASTHRPINNNNNNNDYINPPANKPIVSTLVDQPRPPANLFGTQRPPIVPLNEDYEQPQSSRPSTPASNQHHSRPTSQPNYNNNENVGQPNIGGLGGGDIQANNGAGGGSKYPLNEKSCGLIHETRIVGGDEADPNDFLWMAAIIKSRPTDGEVRPFCGGSLITRRHILTAAHCLEGLAPRDVLVRLGSYDFDDSTASPLSNDYAIDQFRKPAQYSKKTHVADIAIMRLKTPLQMNDNYRTVCMPQARRSYVGALGTVTGYGSQSQTFRRAAPKLRQVTVPIWENRKCSVVYKKNLTESFLCAGFEEGGKDACQGDSGGPLMTEGPNERTIAVGVVSHGIGCGAPGYPGVYTRISTFLDWIEENTRE